MPQSRTWHHVIHCLDQLRQDIVCNADDTPRVTTDSVEPGTAVGQVRSCRDWTELEQWAKQYNSCFKYVNQTSRDLEELQRYIYCPRGSPYRSEIEKVFGANVPFYEEV